MDSYIIKILTLFVYCLTKETKIICRTKNVEKKKNSVVQIEASGQKQKAVPMGLIGDGLALKSGITPSTEIAAPYT